MMPETYDVERERRARTRVEDLPLFSAPPEPRPAPPAPKAGPMTRARDAATSRLAAGAVAKDLNDLQRRVLNAIALLGPIDAAALEQLPEFRDLAPSTVRKRVSELLALGKIRAAGTITRPGKGPITLWRIVR